MVRLPSRAPRLPADVISGLAVPSGEKVVAWGTTLTVGTVGYVVATDRALYADALGGRTPWHRITKATWEEPMLVVTCLSDQGRAGPPVRMHLQEQGNLPAAVNDRVTASVVVNERVDLGDGAKALLVARKNSDDGTTSWTVVFDAGLDPKDPALREAADRALAQLRGSLGI